MTVGHNTVFPVGDARFFNPEGGLTKRELFTAMAMQGMLANPFYNDTSYIDMADDASRAADALIIELSRPANIEASNG